MDMKRYGYVLALSVTTALFGLTACEDSESSPSKPKDEPEVVIPSDSVETAEDLQNCTEKRQEKVAYIEDDSSIRICLDGKWEEAEAVEATTEDLPSCTKKREAATAYVMDDHSYYTCTDERWKKGLAEPESSSSKNVSSSSKEDESSSSKKDEKSSSSNKDEKTSSSSEGSKSSSSVDDPKSSSVEKSSSSAKPEESSSSKEVKPAKTFLTATIYDTDASLHPLFSCYPQYSAGTANAADECQKGAQDVDQATAISVINPCTGIMQGMVNAVLDNSKKPTLTSAGKKCYIDSKYFDQLFNYTPEVNEAIAWEMPFSKNEDGLWGYNSDTVHMDTVVGGFFPVENTADSDIMTVDGVKQGPTPAARTKYSADGPFTLADSATFYRYCNSAGWTGGHNCSGLFGNAEDPSLWEWAGIERWMSQPRNQHFCMEIHGQFTYSEDLEATFAANGDQWVFIGNKLAIDNGGIHVNAPGFVQLKTLNVTYGTYMEKGKEYPIDIFYCARRTNMSGFAIQTNFAITQD